MAENQEKVDKEQADFIKSCVKELQDRYPGLSSTQIALKIGLTQSTFSRIENGQTRPNLVNMSKLLAAVGKTHHMVDVVKMANPDLMSTIEKNLHHNFETPIAGGEIADYFSDPDYRPILLLALTRSGTTREEIKFEYGHSGLKKLDELVNAKVVSESRGIIQAIEEKVTFNQESLRDALISCIKENYDLSKFGTGQNWLSFQTESVNKSKAMALIRAKLQRTYKEIKEEILYSPEYMGNDKVFIGMAVDSLLSDREENLELKQ